MSKLACMYLLFTQTLNCLWLKAVNQTGALTPALVSTVQCSHPPRTTLASTDWKNNGRTHLETCKICDFHTRTFNLKE